MPPKYCFIEKDTPLTHQKSSSKYMPIRSSGLSSKKRNAWEMILLLEDCGMLKSETLIDGERMKIKYVSYLDFF